MTTTDVLDELQDLANAEPEQQPTDTQEPDAVQTSEGDDTGNNDADTPTPDGGVFNRDETEQPTDGDIPSGDDALPPTDGAGDSQDTGESDNSDILKALDGLDESVGDVDIEPPKALSIDEQYEEMTQKYQQNTTALRNFNPSHGLPEISVNGKPLYELPTEQQDEYLTELQDQGKQSSYWEAANAIKQYQSNQGLYQRAYEQHKAEEQQLITLHHVREYDEVQKEFVKQVPGLEQFIPQANAAIEQRLQSDPNYAQQCLTRDGKQRALAAQLKRQGAFDQLRQKYGPTKTAPPSAPDANVSSKKVPAANAKRIWTRAEIDKLTRAEYAKHEKDIDKAMAEGRIR